MSLYMAPTSTSLSSWSDYAVYADACVGSNGDLTGWPEYEIDDAYGDASYGTRTWDSDPSNGFDTGSETFALSASSSGNESLQVGSDPAIALTEPAFGTIQSVRIRAAVEIPAEALWSGVTIQFLKDGVTMETLSTAGPHVNTIQTPNSPQAEQVLTVTPSRSDYNQVIVSGMFRMDCPTPGVPGPNSMFCDVAVVPNA